MATTYAFTGSGGENWSDHTVWNPDPGAGNYPCKVGGAGDDSVDLVGGSVLLDANISTTGNINGHVGADDDYGSINIAANRTITAATIIRTTLDNTGHPCTITVNAAWDFQSDTLAAANPIFAIADGSTFSTTGNWTYGNNLSMPSIGVGSVWNLTGDVTITIDGGTVSSSSTHGVTASGGIVNHVGNISCKQGEAYLVSKGGIINHTGDATLIGPSGTAKFTSFVLVAASTGGEVHHSGSVTMSGTTGNIFLVAQSGTFSDGFSVFAAQGGAIATSNLPDANRVLAPTDRGDGTLGTASSGGILTVGE